MMRGSIVCLALVCSFLGCASDGREASEPARIELVAESARRWTGLTMAPDGRLFVNFPRWSDDVPVSVAEVVDGEIRAWPDLERNAWKPGDDPADAFVCVQSVVHDGLDALWVLDPANPSFAGVVEGGPKLMRFDPDTGRLLRTYRYAAPIITGDSYLNDVRIDRARNVAYVTDSGDGALIVTDLGTGESRRLLDDHPSTEAQQIALEIGGAIWKRPDGSLPMVHADGIALSPDGMTLWFQALTARSLHRIDTALLRDAAASPESVAAGVETIPSTGSSDGLLADVLGRVYISALEHDAIRRFDPRTGALETVIADPRISWPDTFTRDTDGHVLFTTAQIHLGGGATEPFRIYRIIEP